MLSRVAAGQAQGFTVFNESGDVRYCFYENGAPTDSPAEDEIQIPMDSGYAEGMLEALRAEAPEELDELGRLDTGFSQLS